MATTNPLQNTTYRVFFLIGNPLDTPNLGFLYFNFLGGYQLKKTPCMLYFAKGLLLPYIIIVPDAADIVCGAKKIMWSNFAPHDNFGQKSRNHSITNATFCLAQPKQKNMGLKIIFGSSIIYLDQVLANKIFLISKINFQDIIRLRRVSDGMQNFITFAPLSYDIWKIYFAYQKYFVGQNLVQVYV